MPKIIVTSRYLKCGSKKNLANYVKYVATREGSVAVKNIDENAPVTKNQQELILSLLNDFPDSKELFEYEDYVKKPNFKNGSALISEVIDRNMDRLTNRENYVGYLANRPGSVKLKQSGNDSIRLFGKYSAHLCLPLLNLLLSFCRRSC